MYKTIAASLSALIAKYQAAIAPIGSDLLPDFPCKLDTDILICVPDKKNYVSFYRELAGGDIFIVPPQHDGEFHCFFYAELLGTPIDVHVCNDSLQENPVFRRIQKLQRSAELRQKYKQLKLENQGKTVHEYRNAKAAFRESVGWSFKK